MLICKEDGVLRLRTRPERDRDYLLGQARDLCECFNCVSTGAEAFNFHVEHLTEERILFGGPSSQI